MKTTPPAEQVEALPAGAEIVTDDMLTDAEQAARTAAEELEAAERKTGRRWIPGRSQLLEEAQWKARHADRVLDDLKRRRAEQETVLGSRGPAEDAAAPLVADLTARLKAAETRTISAARDAVAALAELADATTDRNALVEEASRALVARGLLQRDAFGRHATGGNGEAFGLHTTVSLSGTQWGKVHAVLLLDWVHALAAGARLGSPKHANRASGLAYRVGQDAPRVAAAVRAPKPVKRQELRVRPAPLDRPMRVIIKNGRDTVIHPDGTEEDRWDYTRRVVEEREADRRTLRDLTYGPMMDDPPPSGWKI